MKGIKITVGNTTIEATLADTACAEALWNILPFSTKINTWGDEIYFSIPIHHELDATAREIVESGDLGYWPSGPAFCIFYGPTPISNDKEIRPASAVNIIGKIIGEPTSLRAVSPGSKITIEQIRKNA
ncbi:MAG: cyclophilin-like fold protein [Thermodesulfobacteriota bacterium]|jgi:hypothetical protein|nr:MAG: cyclophilin-like fold protein [Thermodesulfobacteriota bacterium]